MLCERGIRTFETYTRNTFDLAAIPVIQGLSHLPVIAGTVGALCGMSGRHVALVHVYTAMTGSATAGQRLLALDPADVAMITMDLAQLCERTADAAAAELADLSDPVYDVLAERHERRDMPLFAS